MILGPPPEESKDPTYWAAVAVTKFGAGEWEAAAAAAQIASSMVFLQDAEEVARQMVEEALHAAEVQVSGSAVAVERLAEATRILQRATQKGPRHPAIHAALAVLTGESSIGTSEAKVGELVENLEESLEAARKAQGQPG